MQHIWDLIIRAAIRCNWLLHSLLSISHSTCWGNLLHSIRQCMGDLTIPKAHPICISWQCLQIWCKAVDLYTMFRVIILVEATLLAVRLTTIIVVHQVKADHLLLVCLTPLFKEFLYIESTKFTNKEFRNARNYYNLYDHNINPKWKDIKDKERLGIRRVNNLPPLANGQETR